MRVPVAGAAAAATGAAAAATGAAAAATGAGAAAAGAAAAGPGALRPAAARPSATSSEAASSGAPAGTARPPAGPAAAQVGGRADARSTGGDRPSPPTTAYAGPTGAPTAARPAATTAASSSAGAAAAPAAGGAASAPAAATAAHAAASSGSTATATATAPRGGDAPTASRPSPTPGAPAAAAQSRGDDPEHRPSPIDEFDEYEPRRRWPKVLLVVGVVVLLLGAAYVGAAYALADRVPRGATVAGVQIGGMPAEQARTELERALADTASSPVTVTAGEVVATVDPATAGLAFDAAATVDQLTGLDLSPQRLWQHLVGVDEHAPVTDVDAAALDAAVDDLTGTLTLAPVDGGVVFADGQAHATDAADGWELEADHAAEALQTRWLTDEQPLELRTTPVAPDITQEETDAALTSVAQRVVSGPVTLEVGGQRVELPADVLAGAASMVPVASDLELQLDGAKLSEAVLARTTDLLSESADARFEFQGGAPVIVPGKPGTTLDPAALGQAVATAATGDQRTAAVELVETDPAESTAKLEALGIKEIVSEFSTPLTSEPRRTANIANGARNITGTLVEPGETFSLTEALGPITAANGFQTAGVIVNGEHVDGMGGGLSQISTTTFNAAHFAGFEDVEHRPHSEWFARYPEGREATIYTGTLDMRWKNNTPYGALVQGYVEGGKVHVRIWGTKYWTVESTTSGRSGVVSPTTTYSQSPTCEPQSAGNPGFTVTTTRKLFLEGQLKDTESFTWKYKPQNRVICGAAPTAPAG
ncbi:VanW family protein [Cellulomonas cellasea]|uniref:Vancomycin resistance protein YoaR n=1 Tax=Cellulomonas cellasea TaxID=43670 RepID=A0A7W4YCN7_9CELL|nr:VanW family protein [Cellulomonas cellasea]MBB2923872.1 vancomycin resistance protein YoaR [Cellulomonas cellasea]